MKYIIILLLLPLTFLYSQDYIIRDTITVDDIKIKSGSAYDVRAYGAIKDDGIDDYTAIKAAIDSAESNGGGIVLLTSGTYNTNTTITTTSNTCLKIDRGAIIDGISSDTLIINGTFDAGIYQCFGSNITVFFDTSAVAVAYPEWWGLSTDSTDQVALNAMVKSLPIHRKPKMKLTGTYYTNDTWVIQESYWDSTASLGTGDSIAVPLDHIVVDGYGGAIFSTADTVVRVQLGWLTQGSPGHQLVGLRIWGNGADADSRIKTSWDVGTNIGIYVATASNLTIDHCSIMNCGDALIVANIGAGIFSPFTDGIHITNNNFTINDRGIVFINVDTKYSSSFYDTNFDHTIISGNEIGIQEGNDDSDTLDACIVISEHVALSRSTIIDNILFTTGDSLNAMYINGNIGGTYIKMWYEGNGTAFRIGPWYASNYHLDGYGSYSIVEMTHHSSSIHYDIVTNYTGVPFRVIWWSIGDNENYRGSNVSGYAYSDITGLLLPEHLYGINATGGYSFGADLIHLFKEGVHDTVAIDYSGNYRREGVYKGCTQSVSSTGWTMRSFDGINDAMTTKPFSMAGSKMIITAFIPDSAYDATTTERLWKYYINDSNLIWIDYTNESGMWHTVIFADNGVSTDTVNTTFTYTFESGQPLVVATVIDTIDDKFEIYVNGTSVVSQTYSGNFTSSNTLGNFTFSSEWGGTTGYGAYDLAYFAVYPYVSRTMLEEVLTHLLTVMGGSDDNSNTSYWYNITDYGAVANDASSDMGGIQAAINAAHGTNGGVVYMPRGTYNVGYNDYLKVYSNIAIIGDGVGSTILSYSKTSGDAATGKPVFWVTHDSSITFRDFEIDGNAANNGYMGEFDAGILLGYPHADSIASRIVIERCYIHDTAGDGIEARVTRDVWIHDCKITVPNVSRATPLVGRNAITGEVVDGYYIYDNTLSGGFPSTIDIEPNAGEIAKDIFIHNNKLVGGFYSLSLNGSAATACDSIFINNNIMTGADSSSIVNWSATNYILSENIISCADGHGIEIRPNQGGNFSIINNEIHNCNKYGILVGQTNKNANISGNKIYENVLDGLRIAGDTGTNRNLFFTINNNVAWNNDSGDAGLYSGININYTDSSMFSGNISFDNQGDTPATQKYGFVIANCTDLRIGHNTGFGNTSSLYSITSTSNTQLGERTHAEQILFNKAEPADDELLYLYDPDFSSIAMQSGTNSRWWIIGDSTNNTLQLGADGNTTPSVSDYGITIDTDKNVTIGNNLEIQNGTIELSGDGTLWDNISIPVSSTIRDATNPPTLLAHKAGYSFAFDPATDQLFSFRIELPPSYKEGSNITFYVQWSPPDANAGNIVWALEYSWADIGDAFPAATTISITSSTSTTADKYHRDAFSAITGTGFEIGSIIECKFYRDANNGSDTYASYAFVHSVSVHYEKDTFGSRTITTK